MNPLPPTPTSERQPTPRTDAEEKYSQLSLEWVSANPPTVVSASFARQLESELSTLTTQNAELAQRLEEAEKERRKVMYALIEASNEGGIDAPCDEDDLLMAVESFFGRARKLWEDQLATARLITNICGVCWTNSFEPCEENEKGAVKMPVGQGEGFMCCAMCKLHDELSAALADSRRIDWLEANPSKDYPVMVDWTGGKNLRDTIDTIMLT